jgi:hypothetical protein
MKLRMPKGAVPLGFQVPTAGVKKERAQMVAEVVLLVRERIAARG